jgi:hypothetical protein
MKHLPRIGFASALAFSAFSILPGLGCGALSGLDDLTATSCVYPCDGGGGAGDDAATWRDAIGEDSGNDQQVSSPNDGSTTDDRSGHPDASVDAQRSDVSTARDAALDDAVAADTAPDAPGAGADGNANADGGNISVGLVAFYPFDEASGTTSVDASGNGHTATMVGATFASGLHGNAATLNGNSQYVSLPSGIVSGLSSVTIAAWVRLVMSPTWNRVFDFGTGANVYMFLTPNSTGPITGTRFTIATNGLYNQEDLNGPGLPTNNWEHVCVTLTAGAPSSASVLYINGTLVGQNPVAKLTPADLGNTTSNWLGRSHFSGDPFFNGQIDNFRIYGRPLSASEVQQLFQQQL